MTALQRSIRRWVESRLGKEAMAPHERAMRMLEEALELQQRQAVEAAEAAVAAVKAAEEKSIATQHSVAFNKQQALVAGRIPKFVIRRGPQP